MLQIPKKYVLMEQQKQQQVFVCQQCWMKSETIKQNVGILSQPKNQTAVLLAGKPALFTSKGNLSCTSYMLLCKLGFSAILQSLSHVCIYVPQYCAWYFSPLLSSFCTWAMALPHLITDGFHPIIVPLHPPIVWGASVRPQCTTYSASMFQWIFPQRHTVIKIKYQS
jgi:hypothetical protein